MGHQADNKPRTILLLNRYKIASVAWLIALYAATALTARIDTSPDDVLMLFLFELRHVIMHLLAFAIQAWLIAHAVQLPSDPDTKRDGGRLIALVLILGFGQEALQSVYRSEIRAVASLWDLVVDTGGGAAGWWWYTYRQIQFQNRPRQGWRWGHD